jgi:hypothetical protein
VTAGFCFEVIMVEKPERKDCLFVGGPWHAEVHRVTAQETIRVPIDGASWNPNFVEYEHTLYVVHGETYDFYCARTEDVDTPLLLDALAKSHPALNNQPETSPSAEH